MQHGDHEVVGVDILDSAFTTKVGSITDPVFVADSLNGIDAVIHAAAVHKPHIASHSRQDFVDTNITGTLNLLEAAVRVGVKSFIFTSTTSVFGRALHPVVGAPAVWVTESTGHMLGAAGATEAVFALQALAPAPIAAGQASPAEGWIPASLGAAPVDPEIDLDIALELRTGTLEYVMSNSFAFGGSNVSLLFGPPE